MPSLNTKLASAPNTSSNYVLKATTSTTIGNSLIFDNGTNVGIGTASPFAIADTNLSVNGTTSSAIQLGFNGTRYGQFYTDSGEIRLSAVANLPLTFYSNNLERMRISATGNVGIGTSSPNQKLEVNVGGSTNGANGILNFQWGNGANQTFGMYWNNSSSYSIYRQSDGAGNLRSDLYLNSGGNLILSTSGNVGLATTSPAALLSLKGRGGADIIFQMNDETDTRRCFYIPNQYYGYMWAVGVVSNGGKAFSFGNASGTEVGSIQITATGVNYTSNSSDIRKKKNFENWEEVVLPYFKDINPQKFNYTIEEDGESKTKGFIAQEMYDKFPEAYPLDLDGFHSFNPSGMVVYLMKAIQELNQKLQDQQQTINSLINR